MVSKIELIKQIKGEYDISLDNDKLKAMSIETLAEVLEDIKKIKAEGFYVGWDPKVFK